jgi:Flp pilus assembly protein TadD
VQVRQNLALVLGLQGRLDEAEKIARLDLPPEMVANNMAYLRDASTVQARTWDAMR